MAYSDATWIYREDISDVPSPLYYRDRLYVVNDKKRMMTCLDPTTGQRIWEGSLGDKAVFFASPTAADGKIYCISRRGEAVTLAAGDEFRILSHTEMGGEPCESSIATADGKLFIRTAETLFCVTVSDKTGISAE